LNSDAFLPFPIDLPGTGNSEIAYASKATGKAHALALDDASTGLLIAADDGKGTIARFGYARAPAEPGAGARQSVLRTLTVESLGAETDIYEYDVHDAVRHPEGGFFLGYRRVERKSIGANQNVTFRHDARAVGVMLSSETLDPRQGTLREISLVDVEESTLFGVPRVRQKRVRHGFASSANATSASFLSEASVDTYDARECATVSHATSMHGTSYDVTDYEIPLTYASSLTCLPSREVRVARHADASFDASENVRYVRDARGNVLQQVRHTASGDRTDEVRTYADDGLLTSATRPGEGTVTFAWDASTRLLRSITGNDGTVTRATNYDARDRLIELETDHGGGSGKSWKQRFAYDGYDRLEKTWNDAGPSALEPNLQLHYKWADSKANKPGRIDTSVLFRVAGAQRYESADLMSARGETLASLRHIPEVERVVHSYAPTTAPMPNTDGFGRAERRGDVSFVDGADGEFRTAFKCRGQSTQPAK
jgi:hypothetical protein